MVIDRTKKGETIGRVIGPLVMPFSNIWHLSFQDMVTATLEAGFGAMTMHPFSVMSFAKDGLAPKALRAIAEDQGISITRLDPLSAWNPNWIPNNVDNDYLERFDIAAELFFEFCEQLGCRYASLNGTFPSGRYTDGEVVEYFAATCDLAAKYGVTCDLEHLPMWGVRGLSDAWAIVKAASRPNGGLVFDILHFMRSRSTLEDLEVVPGDLIHCVQINDGPIELPESVSLVEDCFTRLWPGEGKFPILEVLTALARKNALRQVSPEVFSPKNASLSAHDIAERSSRSIRDALLTARIAI
jgi:sugar phosphate isomerase/epimerase